MFLTSLKRESILELKLAVREPAFIIPTLLFPFMFYIFFGLLFGRADADPQSSKHIASYLMITYAVFGIMGPSLFGFGANIAMERDKGWLAIKQVSPVPAFQLMFAKLTSALLFAFIIILGLFALGILFGGVQLSLLDFTTLLFILLLGVLPFCALGMAVGFWVKGSAAIAFINLIYLPMAFLSGLWLPITMLPQWIQSFSQALPPYHLSQLCLNVVGQGLGQASWIHILALIISTVIFLSIAMLGYKKTSGE